MVQYCKVSIYTKLRAHVQLHIVSSIMLHPGSHNLHFAEPSTGQLAPVCATPLLHVQTFTAEWAWLTKGFFSEKTNVRTLTDALGFGWIHAPSGVTLRSIVNWAIGASLCKCSLRKNDAHSQGQRTIVCALILQRTDVRMHSVLSRLRVHPGLQNLHFLAPFTWHSAPIRATPSLHLHSLTTQWQCIDVNLTIVCWDKARTSLNTYEYTVFCRGWRSSQYCMTCISQHHPQSIPRRFAPHHFGTCTNYLPMRSTNARVADSISLVIVTLTKTHSQMHFVLA